MVIWLMYAIRNEDEDAWWNVELEGWVDDFELEGDCLFPTIDMTQNYIDEHIQQDFTKIYKVEILAGQSYDYEPIS